MLFAMTTLIKLEVLSVIFPKKLFFLRLSMASCYATFDTKNASWFIDTLLSTTYLEGENTQNSP